MEIEETSAASEPTDEASTEPRKSVVILRFSIVASTAVIVWVVTWLAVAGTIGLGTLTLSLIVPTACVALFGLFLLRQEQKWVWPVKRMNQMLPQIRAGELPIDSLNEIDGGLRMLAAQMREVFRDLRIQKSRLAEIAVEMNQRVANRTGALERTIGSLRQQATRDALTGLFNRRMLDQFLPQEIERCRGERINLALLMIDVDYFKILNDTLGHAAGDELLRNIGQIIRSSIREHDTAFRCGGDEFVVVLPECNEASAEALASRMQSLVTGLAKTLRIPRQPALSIGIATVSKLQAPTASDLLEEADKRLYEIKSTRKALSRAG